MTSVVLASKSAIRADLLKNAGLAVEIVPADVDERAIEAPAIARGASPAEVAVLLAEAKALVVSRARPGAIVIGADQTLALGDERFSKPRDRAGARIHLSKLRGATHVLASGAAIARDGVVLWTGVQEARLTMRAFSDAFLEDYLDRMGAVVTTTVGGYQLEGLGIQLFERIEGDTFTILGLPLLALLGGMRANGLLAS
jgi:septum formation protein